MYASSVAFVRRVDHSSFILSCDLIGQRENKSRYVTEIVLPLGSSLPRRRPLGFVTRFVGKETRDEPLRTSAWEASSGPQTLFLGGEKPEIRLRSQASFNLTRIVYS